MTHLRDNNYAQINEVCSSLLLSKWITQYSENFSEFLNKLTPAKLFFIRLICCICTFFAFLNKDVLDLQGCLRVFWKAIEESYLKQRGQKSVGIKVLEIN